MTTYLMASTPSKRKRNKNDLPIALLLFSSLLLGAFSLYVIYTINVSPTLASEHLLPRQDGTKTKSGPLSTLENTIDPLCRDVLTTPSQCQQWAAHDHCTHNPPYMYSQCLKSCNGCLENYLTDAPDTIPLDEGRVTMPTVGFGCAGLGDHTARAVTHALKAGYRRFDSAQAREWYREDLVGSAIQAAIQDGIVKREDLFLTTKVHPRSWKVDGTGATVQAAIQQSLKDLGTNYIDMVLLHYSDCFEGLEGCEGIRHGGHWSIAWKALEAMHQQNIIRCIGVSNFDISQLNQLVEEIATVKPCMVQGNSEPFKPARGYVGFCHSRGVHFESYSTLGGQYNNQNPVLKNEEIGSIAKAHGKSPAQVVLRWSIQRGHSVIPRSGNEGHIRENLDVFGFALSDEEMVRIDKLGIDTLGAVF